MFPSLSFRGMCIRVGGVGVWDPLILLSLSAVCRDLLLGTPLGYQKRSLVGQPFFGEERAYFMGCEAESVSSLARK